MGLGFGFAQDIAHAGKVHVHGARTRIGAAQGIAAGGGGYQLARGAFGTKTLGGDGHRFAQRDAVQVDKIMVKMGSSARRTCASSY